MGNWLARIKGPAAVAGMAAMALVTLAMLAAPASAAEKEKKPPPVSEDVAKKLRPANDACNKSDFDTCISLSKEGLAISTKPQDKDQSLRILRYAYGKKGDFPSWADVVEQILDLGTYTDDEKKKDYPNLARVFYQAKNFEKAEKYAKLWAEISNSAEGYGFLAVTYYAQQNCTATIPAQEKANELDAAAGKEPTEQTLRVLNQCYYKAENKPGREAVMEQLLRRFPKADYFADLLQIYLTDEKLDRRAVLNLYRFAFDRDWISRESQFVAYADEALDVGAPAEALHVIDVATQKGAFKIIAATDHNGRLSAVAKQQTAEDKKQIAALDKEARAGKNGEADVKVGLAYMGLGEYDKAAEAIERGLTAERVGKVKRVDDSQMMLGIAYLKLAKKDEAKKAFTAAQQDPRMAKAATIWLQSL